MSLFRKLAVRTVTAFYGFTLYGTLSPASSAFTPGAWARSRGPHGLPSRLRPPGGEDYGLIEEQIARYWLHPQRLSHTGAAAGAPTPAPSLYTLLVVSEYYALREGPCDTACTGRRSTRRQHAAIGGAEGGMCLSSHAQSRRAASRRCAGAESTCAPGWGLGARARARARARVLKPRARAHLRLGRARVERARLVRRPPVVAAEGIQYHTHHHHHHLPLPPPTTNHHYHRPTITTRSYLADGFGARHWASLVSFTVQ